MTREKTDHIELGNGERIPILYEDRVVLAIDKPAGWMLVPVSWQKTGRNLQAALLSSIGSGAFWARCRQLRFLRYVHRLDAETTGVLLLAKSHGGVDSMGDLFESRKMSKRYLAVVSGKPSVAEWKCQRSIGPDPDQHGRMRLDPEGKSADTLFKTLACRQDPALGLCSLVEAQPTTGRTHQIRLHLASGGTPVIGDVLYGAHGSATGSTRFPMALRAVGLAYECPFTRRAVTVTAPEQPFLEAFRFPAGP